MHISPRKHCTYPSHKHFTYPLHKYFTYPSHKHFTYPSHKHFTYASHKLLTYPSDSRGVLVRVHWWIDITFLHIRWRSQYITTRYNYIAWHCLHYTLYTLHYICLLNRYYPLDNHCKIRVLLKTLFISISNKYRIITGYGHEIHLSTRELCVDMLTSYLYIC